MPRHFTASPRRRGQTVIEYCLLVAFMTVIFGSVFSILRRGAFIFWVCDLYPRVAALHSCEDPKDCYETMGPLGEVEVPLCPKP